MFFSWWYSEAYRAFLSFIKYIYVYLADLFSAKTCLKTFLAPWKRDLVSYNGLTLRQKFQVMIWNLISRLVGAIIKFFTLLTFSIAILIWSAISVAIIVIWFLYPLILIVAAVYGLKLIFLN